VVGGRPWAKTILVGSPFRTLFFVAADVRRLILNAEGRMMNEKRAATDLVRFDNFLHSAFFLLHCAFRMSLTSAAASLTRIPKSAFAG
jgi:hypothetical protein